MITVNNFEVLEEENVLTEKDKTQNQEEDDLETKEIKKLLQKIKI